MESGIYPVPVTAKGTDEDALVVPPQVLVDIILAFSLQPDEIGIDELYDIVAPESWKEQEHFQQVEDAAELRCRAALQGDIPLVVAPGITVGDDCHFVPEFSQSFCQCGMQVAVFAE